MKVLNNLSLAAALALIGVSPLWAANNGNGNQFNGREITAVRTLGNEKACVPNSTPLDPQPPINHPQHPGHPGGNPGHCPLHHCPPVVLDCFRSGYGTAVVVTPVGVPDLIIEMPVSTGKPVPVADTAMPQALNGDTITLMFATPQSQEAGRAVLLMGEKTVELTIVNWQAESATVKLPKLLLTQSIPATIYIGNAQGEVFLGQELKIIVQ